MELPRINEDGKLIYALCGGDFCFSNHPKCKNTVAMMKHFPLKIWKEGNVGIVPCHLARVCNENEGLATEMDTRKFLKARDRFATGCAPASRRAAPRAPRRSMRA